MLVLAMALTIGEMNVPDERGLKQAEIVSKSARLGSWRDGIETAVRWWMTEPGLFSGEMNVPDERG